MPVLLASLLSFPRQNAHSCLVKNGHNALLQNPSESIELILCHAEGTTTTFSWRFGSIDEKDIVGYYWNNRWWMETVRRSDLLLVSLYCDTGGSLEEMRLGENPLTSGRVWFAWGLVFPMLMSGLVGTPATMADTGADISSRLNCDWQGDVCVLIRGGSDGGNETGGDEGGCWPNCVDVEGPDP